MNSKSGIETRTSAFSGYIGIVEGDISPPEGIYLGNWGAAISPVSTGLHRPLTMTCITFQEERSENPQILIGMDLGWWKDGSDESAFRNSLLQEFNLPESCLLVCLSHTHSGPSICKKDVSKPGGEHIEGYLKHLEDTAISLIQNALSKAKQSVLTWQYGKCDLAKNRDLRDPGADRYLVGYNPDISADQTLLCGRITDNQGQIVGTIVNYACHPTTLGWENTLISPDYPGAMREIIKEKTNAPVLFIQGASGELAPAIQYVDDLEVADKYGRQLGYSVLSVLESMPSPGTSRSLDGAVESGAPLAIWKESPMEITNKVYAIESYVKYGIQDFPTLSEIQTDWDNTSDPVQRERLWRKLCIRGVIGDKEETEIPLWIWQIGDAYIIAQPNEAYSIFQQQIRATYPGIAIVVANLVNGSIGYLPPRELFGEDIYSVWQTPFAQGSLERLMNKTLDKLKAIEKTT